MAEKPSKQVTIPTELYDRLVKEANRRDVSVTFLATRALSRTLPVWEDADLEALFPEAPGASVTELPVKEIGA